jgi:hypothetical protein
LAVVAGTATLYVRTSHRKPAEPENWLVPRVAPFQVTAPSVALWPSPTIRWSRPVDANGAATPVKVSVTTSPLPLAVTMPSRTMIRRRVPDVAWAYSTTKATPSVSARVSLVLDGSPAIV